MANKISADPRIDPRIKAMFGAIDLPVDSNVRDREEILAEEATEQGKANAAAFKGFLDSMDTEEIASSAGLTIRTEQFRSEPDGNTINIQFIRPEGDAVLPCVYYIHGGGMAVMSCYDGNFRAWGRIIAAQGVAVAMVDFRNSIRPSSAPEIAPYPAALNDCVSGARWVRANAAALGIDPARIIVAGDSGGANLSFATAMKLRREGDGDLLRGIYALCPYLAGSWPRPEYPSSTENEGIFVSFHHNRPAIGYGIEAFEARDPLAWPAFATEQDVVGLPPAVVSVHECDPLRDEGVAFYRLLARAGVPARCHEIKGTIHAIEVFPVCCPDISRHAAIDIANLART